MTSQQTTVELNMTSTPPPSTQGFCLSCGFNFGHIADGVDNTTMGIILVLIVMLIVALCSCAASYFYFRKSPKQKKKYKEVPKDEEEETNDEDLEEKPDNE